ncbi:putative (S)-norcoclaurine synthase [Helianthus anomalus]
MATRNLGSSIPVASVKELVAQSLNAVPERYLRDVDGDCDYPTRDSSLQVPILDMTKLLHPQFHQLELQKLHHACKHWGIFQVNHLFFLRIFWALKSGSVSLGGFEI